MYITVQENVHFCVFLTKGTCAYKPQKLRFASGKVVGKLDIDQDAPTATLPKLVCIVSVLVSQLNRLKCSILS